MIKPPVHIVLVVQLGHYIKSKFANLIFFNESEKITCPCRPGCPTWPLFKIKTETEADKNTLPPRPGRPTWPLFKTF